MSDAGKLISYTFDGTAAAMREAAGIIQQQRQEINRLTARVEAAEQIIRLVSVAAYHAPGCLIRKSVQLGIVACDCGRVELGDLADAWLADEERHE